MPKFIPGLKLCELFYQKEVKPILNKEFPNLHYSAALIGWGSEVQQRLLELVSGEVYHDGLGDLRKIREKLKFYPRDVWLYLLAAQWTRIAQEEAFVGRAGEIGDELGSQVVAARMVREIMKLAFLMEKQYAPYSKWLGTAFGRLKIGAKLTPILQEVLLAKTWKARERKLAQAYSIVARRHNALKITRPLPTKATKYYGRPYLVIHGDTFASSIKKAIKDPKVKSINAIIWFQLGMLWDAKFTSSAD
jgi:hypothetical protein